MKHSLIAIVGQTATGKSNTAVTLAKLLKKKGIAAEIISVDSRQVYKGLNIGTGKITKKEMQGIPHHMLDIVSPRQTYTVASFQKKVLICIKNMHKRNVLPILVGGTGWYMDSVVYETTLPEVPPNKILRKTLEKKSLLELQNILENLDIDRFETIDKRNPIRLIRAIEIATAIGSVPTTGEKTPRYNAHIFGITLPDEILKEKIHARLLARMKQGMVAEAKNLHEKGLSWKRMSELGLEYRALADYLTGKQTKEMIIENLSKQIWQYAKRQKTWFKKNKDIIWIDGTKESIPEKILEYLK